LQPDVLTELRGAISISYPFSSPQLHIVWEHSHCDAEIVFTFRRAGDGYELIGDRPDECPYSVQSLPVAIDFSVAIPVEDIHAVLDDRPEGTSPSPLPTPPAGLTSAVDCIGSPPAFMDGAVRVEDHSGLVVGCEIQRVDYSDVPAYSALPDPPSLTLSWAVACAPDQSPTLLEFWPQELQPIALPNWRPYLLATSRFSPEDGLGCRDAMSGRQVRIDLTEPLEWSDIQRVFMEDGRATSSGNEDVGDFELELAASSSEYAEGEQIDVLAQLTYSGADDQLDVSGLSVTYYIAQVDGPLQLGPGPTASVCRNGQLRSGEPERYSLANVVTLPYTGIESLYSSSPFTLPPGLYVVSASVSLWTSGGCQGNTALVTTTIAITVR
jgi:hypothetical protein